MGHHPPVQGSLSPESQVPGWEREWHVGKSFPPLALSYGKTVHVHQESQSPTQTWEHFTQFGCWVPFPVISLQHHYVGEDPWKWGRAFAKHRGSPEMHGASAVDYHPPLCAFSHSTASAQLFSTESCLTEENNQSTWNPLGHFQGFLQSLLELSCCKLTSDISGRVSWDHWGVSTEQGDNKASSWLEKSKKNKAMSFLDGLSQPGSILSTWGFLCWLFFIFFFPLLVLKHQHIDRCFPYISILWDIKSCCWSSYKSFQGIISFIVTPGSCGNLRGESNILHWLCD